MARAWQEAGQLIARDGPLPMLRKSDSTTPRVCAMRLRKFVQSPRRCASRIATSQRRSVGRSRTDIRRAAIVTRVVRRDARAARTDAQTRRPQPRANGGMKLSYVIVTRNRRDPLLQTLARLAGEHAPVPAIVGNDRRRQRVRRRQPGGGCEEVPRRAPSHPPAGERRHARPQPRLQDRAGATSACSTTTVIRRGGGPDVAGVPGAQPKTAAVVGRVELPDGAARGAGAAVRAARRGERRARRSVTRRSRRVLAGVLPPGRGVRPELPHPAGRPPDRAVRGRGLPPRESAGRAKARRWSTAWTCGTT